MSSIISKLINLSGNISGTLPIANGGTNATTAANAFINLSPLTTAGDLIYENTGPIPARLPIGSSGQVLTVSGGLPAWGSVGAGTVTSVDVSGGTTGLTTSGGPVTTSGTITLAGTLAIANGGTNSTTSLNNNRFIISSGSKIVEASAVTASKVVVSDANGLPTASTTSTTQVQYLSAATGTTGTTSTNVVFSTSPTLVTPVLGTPSSGNLSNCTNYPNVTQSVAGLVSSAGQLLGTNTNDTASSGNVGQYIENNAAQDSIGMTSGTIKDVDSGGGSPVGITLTAGCWDISGVVVFTPNSTTSITLLQAWVGTATGNVTTGRDTTRNFAAIETSANVGGANFYTLTLPIYRVNLSGSQTYYLKANPTFTVSTMDAGGTLRATRVR